MSPSLEKKDLYRVKTSSTHFSNHFSILVDELETGNLIPKEGECFWLDQLILGEDKYGLFDSLVPGSMVTFDAETEIFLKNLQLVTRW